MKTQQLLFLVLTLSVFLLGLAAHAIPSNLLCVCTDRAGDAPRTAGFDLCLVCQLQTGVIVSVILPLLPEGGLVGLNYLSSQIQQKHATLIPHPPTRF
jgi:hypothetical protein